MSAGCAIISSDTVNLEQAFRNFYNNAWRSDLLDAGIKQPNRPVDYNDLAMDIGRYPEKDYSTMYSKNFNKFLGIFGYTSENSEGLISIKNKSMKIGDFEKLVSNRLTENNLEKINLFPGEAYSEKNRVIHASSIANCPPRLIPSM